MIVVEPTSIAKVIFLTNKITESAKFPILRAKVFPHQLRIYTAVGQAMAAYSQGEGTG